MKVCWKIYDNTKYSRWKANVTKIVCKQGQEFKRNTPQNVQNDEYINFIWNIKKHLKFWCLTSLQREKALMFISVNFCDLMTNKKRILKHFIMNDIPCQLLYTTVVIKTTTQNESQQCLDDPQRTLLSKYMDNLFPLGGKVMDIAKLCRSRGGAEGGIVSKIFCWIGRCKLKPCISIILRTEVGIDISWTYFPDSSWGCGLS